MALNDYYKPVRDANQRRLWELKKKEGRLHDIREIQRIAKENLKKATFGRTVGGLLGAAAAAAAVVVTGGLALPAAPAIMAAGVGAGTYVGGRVGTAQSGAPRVEGHEARSDMGIDAKYKVDTLVQDINRSKIIDDAWRNTKLAFVGTGMAGGMAASGGPNVSMSGGSATGTSAPSIGGQPTGAAIPGGAGAVNAPAGDTNMLGQAWGHVKGFGDKAWSDLAKGHHAAKGTKVGKFNKMVQKDIVKGWAQPNKDNTGVNMSGYADESSQQYGYDIGASEAKRAEEMQRWMALSMLGNQNRLLDDPNT